MFILDFVSFIGLLTYLHWPVMIAEIIQRLTIVPTVTGSNLGWSSAASFYSISYITRCSIGTDRFSIMAIKESYIQYQYSLNHVGVVSLVNHNFLNLLHDP